jgi:transposase InsO family protein
VSCGSEVRSARRDSARAYGEYATAECKHQGSNPRRDRDGDGFVWIEELYSLRRALDGIRQCGWPEGSYDFVEDRTHDGRKYRLLATNASRCADIIEEHTRECVAIRVSRKLKSIDVIDDLADAFILRGTSAFIRSDDGPEFIAIALRKWIADVGAKTAYIKPGSLWDNGCESFNSKLREELLKGEIIYSLQEAKVVIEARRNHYNTARHTLHWDTNRRRPRPCYGLLSNPDQLRRP